MGYMT